jgi:hypothetical protein
MKNKFKINNKRTKQISVGCVCCSMRGEFLNSLYRIAERRSELDLLLVELTGNFCFFFCFVFLFVITHLLLFCFRVCSIPYLCRFGRSTPISEISYFFVPFLFLLSLFIHLCFVCVFVHLCL